MSAGLASAWPLQLCFGINERATRLAFFEMVLTRGNTMLPGLHYHLVANQLAA